MQSRKWDVVRCFLWGQPEGKWHWLEFKEYHHSQALPLFFFLEFSYTSHAGFSSFNLGSFSYTSRAGFIFIWGVSLTHLVLALFYLGSYSYISHAGFFFSFSVGTFSLFFFLEFCYISHARFILIWGVSLTHPVLASFFSGEFLLHTPCWLYFSLGSFSYTSHAGFIFYGEFLLHIPYWLLIYLGSFSYTSRAGSVSVWGVSL